ncbi:hypothetical protein VV02_03385 [Luteipulveratus mongoliensis]|uniref:CRISPR-associated protein Cse2 n=2 Tax=Luteipulveratus mongoliensis TaxID=571913 RepID=A0A0K1JEU8_9MICO|nr:hypothetical protein VV02_03385 [Luteipulveratus mongoliensis]
MDAARERISELQRDYLPSGARDQPTARAAGMMAALRRLEPSALTAEPKVWELTLGGLPPGLAGHGDQPSRAERAVHAGLVLYAVHQQSRPEPMHVPGVSLGAAIRRLAKARSPKDELDPATLRRFEQVIVSTTWERRLYHLRELMTLLRAHRLPLDHVRLTGDLFDLQLAVSVERVRLRWGRDLHRPGRSEDQTTSASQDGDQP